MPPIKTNNASLLSTKPACSKSKCRETEPQKKETRSRDAKKASLQKSVVYRHEESNGKLTESPLRIRRIITNNAGYRQLALQKFAQESGDPKYRSIIPPASRVLGGVELSLQGLRINKLFMKDGDQLSKDKYMGNAIFEELFPTFPKDGAKVKRKTLSRHGRRAAELEGEQNRSVFLEDEERVTIADMSMQTGSKAKSGKSGIKPMAALSRQVRNKPTNSFSSAKKPSDFMDSSMGDALMDYACEDAQEKSGNGQSMKKIQQTRCTYESHKGRRIVGGSMAVNPNQVKFH